MREELEFWSGLIAGFLVGMFVCNVLYYVVEGFL